MHTNSSSQKSPISQVQTSEKSSKTCAAINTNVLHASFHFVIVCACSLGIDIDLTQQIKCSSTAPILQNLHNKPNAFSTNMSTLRITFTPTQSNVSHACDFVMEASTMLSSVVTCNDSEPFLFPSLEPKKMN